MEASRLQRALLIVGAALGFVVLFQLVYPSSRVVPFVRLNGTMVGGSTDTALTARMVRDYAKLPVSFELSGKKRIATFAQAGIVTDNKRTNADVLYYPWWQRLIPFSMLVKGIVTDRAVWLQTDRTRFEEFGKAQVEDCTIKPKDAGVRIVDGKAAVDPAKDGRTCNMSSLARQITAEPMSGRTLRVPVKTFVAKPDRSNKDVAPLVADAQRIVDQEIAVTVGGSRYPIDAATLASWLKFPEDPKTRTLNTDLDAALVRAFLSRAQRDVYIAPGTTVIQATDGIEQSRVEGETGRGIDMDKTVASIRAQVLASEGGVVPATVMVLPAKIKIEGTYTATPAGLQALVSDLVKEKGDFAISVRKLGDQGVHANGTKQYHPASTYKMYVGWAVIKRIQAGQMNWTDTTVNGQTVAQCFDAMIVNSDNPCGEWLGAKIGWTNLNNQLKGIGLTCTNLSTAWLSCANDEALFLQKLETGQLLDESGKARLIDVMKRQIFRSGIPKGVGVPAADKVGFIDGYLHDAAIVYSPKGTYVMTIMSKGSSWANIADAAQRIQAQMDKMLETKST